MIKVSVIYPNEPGATFDHDYYRDRHMPMVQARLGAACRYYSIDKGLGGATPGSLPPFVAMCHIYCDTVEAFEQAFAPHAGEILGDIRNYTGITPLTQISAVVVDAPLGCVIP